MEPVTIAGVTALYAATKIVDQFISQEGYGWFKNLFFRKATYENKLYQIIEKATLEHEKKYPYKQNSTKIPFYHSAILFDVFNKIFLLNHLVTQEELIGAINEHGNIIIPNKDELECFYINLRNEINNCQELKKLHIEDNYKSEVFQIADSLFNLTLLVKSIDERLTFSIDQKWLDNRCRESISDLGNRYTPDINLELEVAGIFEGLGRTLKFSTVFYEKFDAFLTKANNIGSHETLIELECVISENSKKISELFKNINFSDAREYPIEEFKPLIDACNTAINDAENILWHERERLGEKFHERYGAVHQSIHEFSYQCIALERYLTSTTVTLANNPFLLLEGEAGIGKSHLLADIVKNRISSGYASLFFLGQHLITNEAPWIQIFKRLYINTTPDDFLEKINSYGERSEKKIIIFIDAINEGCGNTFWSDHINSFVDSIKGYKWLGLVLSIRSSYKNITITSEQTLRNNFVSYRHLGFESVEADAANMFFDFYGIVRPSVPLLNHEFKNPLFLKLLCEGIKKRNLNEVPRGLDGITSIIDFFVDGINLTLSSVKRQNYNPSFKLVKKAIDEIIRAKLNSGKKFVALDAAFTAVQKIASEYVQSKTLLDDLINEGILIKGIFIEDNSPVDVVYLAYERFDDHLTIAYLLENVSEIDTLFVEGGKLHSIVENEDSFYLNQGAIEALSIQLPEKYGIEIYEVLTAFSDNTDLMRLFINSFLWRKPLSINSHKIEDYLNSRVFKYQSTFDHFLETVISLSSVENHPYNADFLHDWLMSYSLPIRDSFWTTSLKHKDSDGSSFRQLIDWAWGDNKKTHISSRAIELISTSLCWFLTSSNRTLRDCSTKSLVVLLENRIEVLSIIIKKFSNVDDPYIRERIYAVALGCTLRTKQKCELKELAILVYKEIFENEEVFPHILLRDYARGIIEYVSYIGIDIENVDLRRISPPYKSSWPAHIPTKKELIDLYDNREYSDLWSSIMAHGDFARYIIGTNHNNSDWSGSKVGEQTVNLRKIFRDFKTSLSSKQLELFDSLNPFITAERSADDCEDEFDSIFSPTIIGRKDEDELNINRSAFKASLSSDMLHVYEAVIEPSLDHNHNLLDTHTHFDLRIAQRFIFNRVIELGWTPKEHLDFDKKIGTGRGRRSAHQERIGKKYQWIAYHEFMARLADNFIRYDGYGDERRVNNYLGPWDPYIRDIDPTVVAKETGNSDVEDNNCWWNSKEVFNWNCSNEKWVRDATTILNPKALIELKDPNGSEWLVLKSFPSWKEPKLIGREEWGYPRKEVWCHLNSYLVKNTEFENIKAWIQNQHFMGRWMPESPDRYQLFSREYYWSTAFKSFESDANDGGSWKAVYDRDTRDFVANLCLTSISYYWEEEYDYSKSQTLSFLKPNTLVFENMSLSYGDKLGSFIDVEGNIVCFAAEALKNTRPHLLVRKKEFLDMLEREGLSIIWTLLGEKGIIGGSLNADTHHAHTEFSGAFFSNNGEIVGEQKIYSDRDY